MTPLKLTAKPESTDRTPPSLIVRTMSDKHLCTIKADGEVSFNPAFNYSTDELEHVLGIEKLFFTIYNSIVEKDKLIASLKEENKELKLNLNPVIERQ